MSFARSKALSLVLVVVAVFLFSAPLAHAEEVGSFHFIFGNKQLDKGDWDPVDLQQEWGMQFAYGGGSWPVQIATDIFFFSNARKDDANGVRFEGETSELALGVRKVWGFGKFRLDVGSGAVAIRGRLFVESFGSDIGSGVGGWVDVRTRWVIHRASLGIGVRYSAAPVSIFGHDIQGGGLHYGLIIGSEYGEVK